MDTNCISLIPCNENTIPWVSSFDVLVIGLEGWWSLATSSTKLLNSLNAHCRVKVLTIGAEQLCPLPK